MNTDELVSSEGTVKLSSSRVRTKAVPNIMCTMALIAIGCTPYLDYNVSNAVKLFLFILWLLSTAFIHVFTGREKGFNIVVGFSIFLALQLLYSIIGVSRELVFFLANCHIYVIPVSIVYIYHYYNPREIKFLWIFLVIIFGVNLLDNIWMGMTQGEMVFRNTEERLATNAGSTSFVVGSTLLIPILYIATRKSQKRKTKIYLSLYTIALLYYISFLNTRATSLIVFLFIVLGYFLIEISREKPLSRTHLLFRLILILICVLFFASSVLNFFLDVFSDNVRMLSRIEDLSYIMSEGDLSQLDEGSLYIRSILWMASINTFFGSFHNFLFGVGEVAMEMDVYSLLSHGVGNHSEFFDLAARYGIVGVLIFYYIIKNTWRFFVGLTKDEKMKNYLYVFLLGVLFMGFVNGLTKALTTMLIIYFMLALTVILIEKKEI